jgi:ArsR family transcriptional regulator
MVELLKALADRQRLRILAALHQADELCACQLVELLGLSGATTSRHLAVLKAAGLLRERRDGRWSHFRLGPELERQPGLAVWLRESLPTLDDAGVDQASLVGLLCCPPSQVARRQRQARC